MANLRNIEKFVNLLRTTNIKQSRFFALSPDGSRCALGLIHDDLISVPMIPNDGYFAPDYGAIRGFLDLNNLNVIWRMNDNGKSFSQIADALEEKYLKTNSGIGEHVEYRELVTV